MCSSASTRGRMKPNTSEPRRSWSRPARSRPSPGPSGSARRSWCSPMRSHRRSSTPEPPAAIRPVQTWTRVTAPIDGRISRAQVTAGNFVSAGQTMLTTLVSLDPIYVTFDNDEQAYLKNAKQAHDGDHASSRDSLTTVLVGLANENGYPHNGVMVFVDNAL